MKQIRVEDFSGLNNINPSDPAVWLFILPYGSSYEETKINKEFPDSLEELIGRANDQTVMCFLASSRTSAEMMRILQDKLHYKLWIAVKYKQPIIQQGNLSNNHCALLILTKYKENLKHTKTRIAYTYCPACDKTTKDYGGKKHTYHEYGTLMSDIWRDIAVNPDVFPKPVIDRLKDVFGLAPYKELLVVDMQALFEFKKSVPSKRGFDLKSTVGLDPKFCNILAKGNCLDILKEIPSNSVDYCFADPPYNLRKKYDNWQDDLDIHEYFQWCDKWLYELGRIIKPGHVVSVLNIPLWAARHYEYMRKILDFHSLIVWEGLSLPVRMIMPANYIIMSFSKGKPRPVYVHNRDAALTVKEFYCVRQSCINMREEDKELITDLWWDIHRLKHNTRRVDHPCQLPPALMRRLISLFTEEGEIVLDPFNGVGTTSLSAAELGRNYFGIEVSDYYHKIAQQRHKELSHGLDPFRKNHSTPKAKNSPVPRLKQQKYEVSKKTLQLEVKRIAKEIGRLPTRQEVMKYARYPIHYYDEYFISWGEVCAAARTTGMTEIRNTKSKVRAEEYQLRLFP